MMTSFERIMTTNEAAGIRSVCKKWMVLSSNLKKRGSTHTRLPDLFWRVTPGVGTSTMLRLFADFMEECGNLTEQNGEMTVLEKHVHYRYGEDAETLRRPLTEAMENATGHRDSFNGILALYLDEWVGHTAERSFLELLDTLKHHDRGTLIVFVLSAKHTDEEVAEFRRTLSLFFRLEEVELHIPETVRLMDFVRGKLSEEGITLEQDAEQLLKETVEVLRDTVSFKGYNTLTMLSEDIAYEALSMGEFPANGRLSAAMLSGFSKESAYIKRLEKRDRQNPRIGFQ